MGFALTTMQLNCTAFSNEGSIPIKYTGVGEDVSPEFNWVNPPDGTKGYAIVCHDPDAPLVTPAGNYGFVHWALYNVPASITELAEDCSQYTQGINDMGNSGYNGPMPPEGHGLHRYYFWILALQKQTELEAGLTLWELLKAVEPDIIGMNRLIGTYQR